MHHVADTGGLEGNVTFAWWGEGGFDHPAMQGTLSLTVGMPRFMHVDVALHTCMGLLTPTAGVSSSSRAFKV